MIAVNILATDVPPNGIFPVSITNRMTPKDQMSTSGPTYLVLDIISTIHSHSYLARRTLVNHRTLPKDHRGTHRRTQSQQS